MHMDDTKRTYIAIDLKSFYASAECAEHGFDPLDTNLVVADESRTSKTICLAVSPSLKALGISGRPRLYEVEQKIKEVNRRRQRKIPGGRFRGKSIYSHELEQDPSLETGFFIAVPRMAMYIEYSTRIYDIYLRYIAPEDIHVYSIDEVFMDVTSYLNTYGMDARELAVTMIRDVLKETGITATAGIGDNLYLAKVAMDIVAKHMPADQDGMRIARLDEQSYRRLLWTHEPLRDFWRVGRGYAKRLEQYGLYTMGDIARFSLENDDVLYKEFGVNAELLIDHAWGYEPCTIADIKAYKPDHSSLGIGQVLPEPYSYEKGKIIIREMADSLAMSLAEKNLVTDRVTLFINYDTASETHDYNGTYTTDYYGRTTAHPGGGSASLDMFTASPKLITDAVLELYRAKVNARLLIRRINVSADRVIPKQAAQKAAPAKQLDLFSDPQQLQDKEERQQAYLEKEEKIQQAMLEIRHRFGTNAVLRGTNLEEGATGRERNRQIGGHRK